MRQFLPILKRPAAADVHPNHAPYVAQLPPGDLLAHLVAQIADFDATVAALAGRAEHRYAPGKWSVREVLRHIVETERVMAYRAMCIARRDPFEFPSFEEDDYVANGRGDARGIAEIAAEFRDLRRANVSLFSGFDDESLSWFGRAAEKRISPLILLCICHGHAAHHLGVLRTRYTA